MKMSPPTRGFGRFPFAPAIPLLTLLASFASAFAQTTADSLDFFEKRVRPILDEHCYACHSGRSEKLKAGLRVDTREHLLAGGDTGPAIVPGHPEQSLLMRAVSYEDPDLQMPPKTRLSASAVADLKQWIAQGAVWPASISSPSPSGPKKSGFSVAQRRAQHWAWKPIQRTEPPIVKDSSWAASPVDPFILAGLESIGLRPAPRAARHTLLRRASFALIGLPPTPDEITAFEKDPRPDRKAFRDVVNRLLESPQFGERWARHWLDKVRYAETMGHEFDYPILGASRYRDYVVRAFNQDLPWDTFTREHIAGDLLPNPRIHPADGTLESRLATAHFWLCQQVHSPVDVRAQMSETIDNQIDVVSKAFLGLTVSCARCHDHKFDAVSTQDYYALHGILSSSRHAYRAVDDPTGRLATAADLRSLRTQLPAQVAPLLPPLLRHLLVQQPDRVVTPTPNAGPIALRDGDLRLGDDGWFSDGEAFLPDAAQAGLPAAPGEKDPLRLVLPGWRHSGALARRFQGSLRSPTFTLDRDFLHLRIAGTGSRFGIAVEGFPLLRSPIYGALRQTVRNPDPHWVTVNVSMWKGRRVWLDFSDLSEPDPASDLPPASREIDGWIAVGDVVLSSLDKPPQPAPGSTFLVPNSILDRWATQPSDLNASEVAWLNGLLAAVEADLPRELTLAWRDRDRALPPPVLATTMADGTGTDEPVFIRGNHRTPGPVVPRRFLEALSESDSTPSNATSFRTGSGRLALAQAITAPNNPLFDRVFVNWVWAHLFGRGLVGSVDNFGVLGEPPTHPELLDWLASEFQAQGRSPKALLRTLLTSESWQMTSRHPDPSADEKDPDNLRLHRAHVRRLEGETIRDSVLAVSGRLDRTLGGPSVPIHLTPFMEGRGRPDRSGPIDGNGRRSLYIEVRRNFLSPFMLAFDQPVPATTVGRRTVSNVPAQALALMNDPFVTQEAHQWAEQALKQIPGSAEDRMRHLYAQAYARRPTPEELAAAQDFLDAELTQPSANGVTAWTDLCHALINAKEFYFVD